MQYAVQNRVAISKLYPYFLPTFAAAPEDVVVVENLKSLSLVHYLLMMMPHNFCLVHKEFLKPWELPRYGGGRREEKEEERKSKTIYNPIM